MTLSFEDAKEIVQQYRFLVGSVLVEDIKISEIAIVPAENDQYREFRLLYHNTKDKLLSLLQIKFNPEKVRIELFAWHKEILLVRDFDDFIKNKMPGKKAS